MIFFLKQSELEESPVQPKRLFIWIDCNCFLFELVMGLYRKGVAPLHCTHVPEEKLDTQTLGFLKLNMLYFFSFYFLWDDN